MDPKLASEEAQSEPVWLEASLIVDGEMAEAVAEVLGRFAPGGVAMESTAIRSGPEDPEGTPVGPLRVVAYLTVDENLEDTRQRLVEALWYLGRIRPVPAPEFRLVQETDWSAAWKEHYRPIQIGRRLIIVPAWLDNPDPTRVPVRIDPGMAFGTGAHPTTQLCLELIEERLAELPAGQRSLIDIGCGSAILSIAALKLGATSSIAVDVDLNAIKNARKNAAANEIGPELELGVGSVDEILNGQFSRRRAPLVVANILTSVLIRLFERGLSELLTPDGHLILSGILAEQVAEIEAASAAHGLKLASRRQIEDWVALNLARPVG